MKKEKKTKNEHMNENKVKSKEKTKTKKSKHKEKTMRTRTICSLKCVLFAYQKENELKTRAGKLFTASQDIPHIKAPSMVKIRISRH